MLTLLLTTAILVGKVKGKITFDSKRKKTLEKKREQERGGKAGSHMERA